MKYFYAILFLFCVSPLWAADDWESRAIIGWHQAGASSADSTQNLFFDFYVARPLGSSSPVYDNKYSLWGQVRVASSPQQRTIPLSQFATDFVNQLSSVPVNELAQSAEFLTGIEARPWGKWSDTGAHTRTIGVVGFFGASGTFKDPTTQAQIFRVPPVTSPQWANFVSQFKEFADPAFRSSTTYLALVPPDRERFYRQYGFGIRYTSYASSTQSPAMYTATLGQDQSISRGRYIGPVLKFDAFYPLPLSATSFIYLFGTANLAVARPQNGTPLALQLVSGPCAANDPTAISGVNCGVKVFQDTVVVHTIASARDTYRIGVGIDAIAFINTILKKN